MIPVATRVGAATGAPQSSTISVEGGQVAAQDGGLVIVVPAGSVPGPTTFRITPITNQAPGGIRQAFRLEADPPLQNSVVLTFDGLAPADYPPGTSIANLSISTQDAQGFWHRAGAITRSGNTVSATVSHFSDWALVLEGTPVLRGSFTLEQRVGDPFDAQGEGLLYARTIPGSTDTNFYFTGTITVPAQITIGTAVCTPDATTKTLTPNAAEIHDARFRWGLNARWGLECVDGGVPSSREIVTLFDTLGFNLPCAGSYVGTQVNGLEFIQGGFTTDCLAQGTVTATWDFRSCWAGGTCQPADACLTGTIACDPAPACVPSGNAPDGTSCGADQVCSSGACVGCVESAACTPADVCHTGIQSCSAGPVCNDTGDPAPNGSNCGVDQACTDGVCTCVSGPSETCQPIVCNTAAIACDTGSPVCTQTPVSDGTSCGTNLACTGGVCTCVPGPSQSCQPADACHDAAITCDTGSPVCTQTAKQDGTTCGIDQVCSAGACVSCVEGPDASCQPIDVCNTAAISCATGGPVCEQTPTNEGGICGTDRICTGGVCTCDPGPSATCSPVNACNTAEITCDGSGNPVCTQTPTNEGLSCGTDRICAAGACVCDPGPSATCSPVNACNTAEITCDGSGNPVCTQTPTNEGLSCGTDRICTGGVCTCVPGPSASCQPIDACHDAAIACDGSGNPVCEQTPVTDGTSCGIDQVCWGGVCGSCVGAPDGTPCGTDQVCSAQSCVACAEGSTCTPEPLSACRTGIRSCSAGPVCTDTGVAPDDQVCGTDLVCSAGACVCDPGPSPSCVALECNTAEITCDTGDPVCTQTPVPDDTPCSTGLCTAGTCGPPP
jgi:hypothetical protein